MAAIANAPAPPSWGRGRNNRPGWLPSLDEGRASIEILVVFLLVVAGIYTGVVTATESAAAAALVMLLIFLLRGLGRKGGGLLSTLGKSVREAMALCAMIFSLMVGSAVSTYFLVASGATRDIVGAFASLDVPPTVILILILLLFIPLGMFLEGTAILLVAVPLVYPVVESLGYSGVWSGILIVKTIELGLVTPPVGLNCFGLSASVPGLKLGEVFKGAAMLIPVDIVLIAILFAFPQLVLWLPSTLGQ